MVVVRRCNMTLRYMSIGESSSDAFNAELRLSTYLLPGFDQFFNYTNVSTPKVRIRCYSIVTASSFVFRRAKDMLLIIMIALLSHRISTTGSYFDSTFNFLRFIRVP
jgi:hypothetical protein